MASVIEPAESPADFASFAELVSDYVDWCRTRYSEDTWFVDQVFRSSNTFDYAAERLVSEPVTMRGYFDRTEDGDPTFEERRAEGRYRTTVVVRRHGEAIFPVDVLVRFENGDQARERWDGQARWRAYEYDRPSRAVSVQVDPERVGRFATMFPPTQRGIWCAVWPSGSQWTTDAYNPGGFARYFTKEHRANSDPDNFLFLSDYFPSEN